MLLVSIIFVLISISSLFSVIPAEIEISGEKRLRDDLMRVYNWPVRPVKNYKDQLWVYVRFKLSSIVGLDLKDQILSLNVKIDQEWTDYKFQWDPDLYEGIDQIILPANNVWLPDFEHYNKFGDFYMQADNSFVRVHHNGHIKWTTGRIIRSFCLIQVRYYPFDIQNCFLSFGSWTFDGNMLYTTLKDVQGENGTGHLAVGMDLSEYYPSSEWDLISIPANSIVKYYDCCSEPYVSISVNVTLRRHPHFYLMNLVMPLVGLSYLSLLVFYLPADSGEKITLCVSLITCQVMFLLLMMDNIPVTSLAVPLLGKIIVFNMILVFLSVICTTIVLNVYYRKPSTHKMPHWVTRIRFTMIPKLIFIETMPVPKWRQNEKSEEVNFSGKFNDNRMDPESRLSNVSRLCGMSLQEINRHIQGPNYDQQESTSDARVSRPIRNALNDVLYVRSYMEKLEQASYECEDWKFLASVLDRIFLILFNVVFIIGTMVIMMDAPALYDQRKAVNKIMGNYAANQGLSNFRMEEMYLSNNESGSGESLLYDEFLGNNHASDK